LTSVARLHNRAPPTVERLNWVLPGDGQARRTSNTASGGVSSGGSKRSIRRSRSDTSASIRARKGCCPKQAVPLSFLTGMHKPMHYPTLPILPTHHLSLQVQHKH